MVILSQTSTAQSTNKDLENMMDPKWKIDQTKEIYQTKVIRREGENDKNAVTNISYQSYSQLVVVETKKAEDQMWSDEQKKTNLDLLSKYNSGGKVHLYLERSTIGSANTKYFTIIIKDLEGNEIFRKTADERIAKVPSSDGLWWNNVQVSIDKEFTGTFYVYVIDALGGEKSKYKFEVIN
jgi:hypothetical protein